MLPVDLVAELRRLRRHRKEPYYDVVRRTLRLAERQRVELARLRSEVGTLRLAMQGGAGLALALEA